MTAPAGVGRGTVRAVMWAFVAATGKRFLTLIGLTLLARVLAPHDFGLIGFAMVYITFAETIGDFGSGMALVYWPDRREDAAQATFAINVVAGMFWGLISFLLAPYVAAYFHSSGGVAIVRALSPCLLIKALGNTHDALAQKDLRFRARTIPELALTGFKALVAVTLAHLGLGPWSLVWGQLAGLTAWTVMLWIIVPWRPSLYVARDLIGPILRYGRSIVAVNVLATVMFDVDLIVVGRFLGVTVLGLYQMATRVPEATVMVLLWVVSKVLFPAFSRLHAAGEGVKDAYLAATRCVSSLTSPASAGLFFLARPIVLVFFGAKWIESAPILAVLALYIGIRSIDHHSGDVLKATGQAHVLATLNLVKVVLIIPAVIVGAMYSAVAVAEALACVYLIGVVITLSTASKKINVPLRQIVRAFTPSAIATGAMSLVLFGWMRWSAFPPIFELAGGVLAGGAVYAAVLRLIDPEVFRWIRNSASSPALTPSPVAEEELVADNAP